MAFRRAYKVTAIATAAAPARQHRTVLPCLCISPGSGIVAKSTVVDELTAWMLEPHGESSRVTASAVRAMAAI